MGCTCISVQCPEQIQEVWNLRFQEVWKHCVSSVQLATVRLKHRNRHIGNCQNIDSFVGFKLAQDFVLGSVFHGSGAALCSR